MSDERDPFWHEGLEDLGPLPPETVLQEAQRLVHGDRRAAYGHPLDDYTRTAGLVSALLGSKLLAPITAEEMILVMCCVKLSRQINAPQRDNMTDLAGYAACEQMAIDERAARAVAAAEQRQQSDVDNLTQMLFDPRSLKASWVPIDPVDILGC